MGSRNQIWKWPNETIWQKYCGFLDLSREEFYEIQRELLQDELLLVHKSPLGKHLLRDTLPRNIGDFRQACRLTTYRDYQPFLEGQQDASLAETAFRWVDGEAYGGTERCVPYTKPGYETAVDNTLAAFILNAASRRGEVNLRPQDRMFWELSGQSSLLSELAWEMTQRFGFSNMLPASSPRAGEPRDKSEFGWGKGMTGGLDILLGSNHVLAQLGEDFSNSRPAAWLQPALFHPTALLRLAKGYLKSRFLGRKMMPKDLWAPKVLLTWQLGDSESDQQTARYWGKSAYQPYFCPEGGLMGLPGWNREDVTLIPYSNFYEFIPEDEYLKSWQDADYRPDTVLFHELVEGRRYELVITNLHGMPFLRYRVGHLVKVTAEEDPETGVRLPQIAFESSCDQRLDRVPLPFSQEPDMGDELTLGSAGEAPGVQSDAGKVKRPVLTGRD